MNRIARFIATGAYTGYAPVIPGTFGTLPGVALAPLFALWLAYSPILYTFALIAAVAIAIWAASVVVEQEQLADPQIIVVDEVIGYLLTLAFLPVTFASSLAAFVAFRIFDIVKPPPAPRLERLPGGLGVVADDLWAGILGNLVLRLLFAADLL